MLIEQLRELEMKIQVLLSKNKKLEFDHQNILDELERVTSENKKLIKTLQEQEDKLATLKTANAMLGSDDYKTKTKLKINALIREIDQCINQLAS